MHVWLGWEKLRNRWVPFFQICVSPAVNVFVCTYCNTLNYWPKLSAFPLLCSLLIEILLYYYLDKCKVSNGECIETANCINKGSFIQCICKQGYSGDGASCTGESYCNLMYFSVPNKRGVLIVGGGW